MKKVALTENRSLVGNSLVRPVFKAIMQAIIFITAFEYLIHLIILEITVFWSHLVGITLGVIFICGVVYKEQQHWQKLFAEKIEEIEKRNQIEEQLRITLESLRKAVGATIRVLVSAVEMRDPYTAGHQIRSANLARAIATEMGLSQEKIDAIRMAGSIHDIGKISIPAEILSKPTKLSDIEFALIREHAQKGFEMLKDVESSRSLAEIVCQHHERMDGSGYPRGLKGEEILLEARILAVADVVEAMNSHRPYRSGLGIDAALAEIIKNKGILYDSIVVDACLNIFKQGYRFDP
jgi:putative nucleotidyltransferase with HDIG domain